MKITSLIKTRHTWLDQSHDEGEILIASLGRLTRALAGHRFPGWSTLESRQAVLEELRPRIQSLTGFKTAYRADMAHLSQHERKLLLERKLISPSMAARAEGCEIFIPKKQDISIMLNEEEHLVLHSFAAGNAITRLRARMEKIARQLEQELPFAKSEEGDYLSSIPAECGNCLQMYLVLHLPALVISNLMKEINKALEKLDLQLSAFYSDGHRDTGDIFVLYMTPKRVDQCEYELIKLQRVAKTLVTRERQVRNKLINLRPLDVRDQITRALGRLLYATTLSFTEMANAISLLMLGTSYGILEWEDGKEQDIMARLRLFNTTLAPAHLAQSLGLSTGEQDSKSMMAVRAKRIQEQLATLHVRINNIEPSLSQQNP